MSGNTDLIRAVEELSLNAWPCLQTVHYDGWLLRFAEGYTRRANSVNPLYPSTLGVEEKIRYCEAIYTARGQDTVFKLTEAAQPDGLDTVLAGLGYIHDAPTSVQVCELADLELSDSVNVSLSEHISEDWLADFCRLNSVAERHIPTMTRMLNSIVPERAFTRLREDGETIAVGLAVLERGCIGLFDIVTAPPYRNRGYGRQLMLHLLGWGRERGAARAYLQVMRKNAPALHLYDRLGFREVYGYWYRVKRL
jgi:GNAT superfamily N-acetyltransferase